METQPQSEHKFYLAPLRGITDRVFREVYERHYGRFDYMLAPFVSTVRGKRVRDYHISDIMPTDKGGVDISRLIPQIIGNDAEGFLLLCRRFAEIGFSSVNWNLGCPAPNIAKKQRGSGLLPHKDIIERFLGYVVPRLPLPLSIKARLGLTDKGELAGLIPMFNGHPLKELIIHPRTGAQMYGGTVDADMFEVCFGLSRHPVVYNGDICSTEDFEALSNRFPNVKRWMIGRGVVKRPMLLGELKTGSMSTAINTALKDFLDDLLDACKDHHPVRVLGRMKEIWRYLGEGIDGTGELTNSIIRCGTLAEYNAIVEKVFT